MYQRTGQVAVKGEARHGRAVAVAVIRAPSRLVGVHVGHGGNGRQQRVGVIDAGVQDANGWPLPGRRL